MKTMQFIPLYAFVGIALFLLLRSFWPVVVYALKNIDFKKLGTRALKVYFVITVIYILIATFSCAPVQHTAKLPHETGTPEQWAEFLECSKDEGDAGCEECYYKVYGVWVDSYLTYKK